MKWFQLYKLKPFSFIGPIHSTFAGNEFVQTDFPRIIEDVVIQGIPQVAGPKCKRTGRPDEVIAQAHYFLVHIPEIFGKNDCIGWLNMKGFVRKDNEQCLLSV